MTPDVQTGEEQSTLVREYEACRSLWASVVWQALSDAMRLSRSERHHERALHEDAVRWFSSEIESVGSFVWVCSVINLDPERVRAKVERMVAGAEKVNGKLPRHLIQVGVV